MNIFISNGRRFIEVIKLGRVYHFPEESDMSENLLYVYAAVESEFILQEREVRLRRRMLSFERTYIEMFLHAQEQPNWRKIKPLFTCRRIQTSIPTRVPSKPMDTFIREYDRHVSTIENRLGLPQSETMRYRLHGSNQYIDSFVRQAKSDLSVEKLINAFTKYGKDTVDMKNKSPGLTRCMRDGYLLLMEAMDTLKGKGVIRYQLRDNVMDMLTVGNNSSGLRAGVDSVVSINGVRTIIKVNGSKNLQHPYVVIVVEKIIRMIKEGQDIESIRKYVDQACKIELKDEHLKKIPTSEAEATKFKLKVRDFFLPSFVVYMLSYFAQKDRQFFERGDVIKIGHRWWDGGAQRIAEYVGANDPDIVFDDADFDGLDTTLMRPLLDMYSASALYYYNAESPDIDVLKAFVRLSGESLSVKYAHLYGDVWKTIIGGMPSGAFQTSHGDSWCVALMWYTFLSYVMQQHPFIAAELREDVKKRKVGIIVYGDDAIYFYRRKWIKYLNLNIFSEWVFRNFGMVMRDIRLNVPFYSRPDFRGESTNGVVFLKRNFIVTPSSLKIKFPGIADVLPYRSVSSAEHKIVYGSSSSRHTPVCEAISMIGAAYDTFGTNTVLYNLVRGTFEALMRTHKIYTLEDLPPDANRQLEAMVRKLSIPREQLLAGFPDLDSLLRRHVYKVLYKYPITSYHPGDIEEEGYDMSYFGV